MQKLCDDQQNQLQQLMECDFVKQEYLLYLDTHPWDQKARAAFHHYDYMSGMLAQQYARRYPETGGDVCGIFPWEICYEF